MSTTDEIGNQIVTTLFDNKFDINNFKNFLKEALPDVELRENRERISKEFISFIDSAYDLGLYKGEETNPSKFLKIFAVKLKKSSSLTRARTMQRNLIAKFLIRRSLPSALVAFYDDSDDWRLSFVKVSKELFRDRNNNLRTRRILSPPKRFSFLVGGEKNHTCKSRFLSLIENSKIPKLKDIEDVFSVESVTDEFFKEYKRLYLDLRNSLENIRKLDSIVDNDFKHNNIKSSDFAKKLMGQLVFIYFLQKKGLLGVEKEDNWGMGSRNFLREIFDECIKNKKNFFNDVLENLFYEGFSVEKSDYHYDEFGYKIPFLNGGLFEPINGYDWKSTDIVLDNSIFEEIISTFDKFNFTVKEDEPLEKEVAVDPEMLGKVFESLLEENEQKNKGAYYTPRYIVHHICQESLIKYLSINSDVSEDDLRIFILKGDAHIDSIIKNHEERERYHGKEYTPITLPDSIQENSEKLELLLSKVKIIDPAVGSGAFPVGMMNEIVKARNILSLLNNVEVKFYDLKKDTIENSLYGVDIELSATDITKLRLWLSLIVDDDKLDFIRPLPNLDNKIMCGNSLVDSFEDVPLFDASLIDRESESMFASDDTQRALNELESKKREYFRTSGVNSKNELKKEIKDLKWKIIESYLKDVDEDELVSKIKQWEYREDKPFFVWELEFSEVFKSDDPGFDIVIGNPPYGAKLENKEYINEKFLPKKSESYFIKLSYDKLIKDNGVLGFIIPKPFTYTSSYTLIREHVLNHIETVIDCGKVWKNVKLEQIILFINKSQQFDYYNNGTRIGEILPIDTKINKELYGEFNIILDGVDEDEIKLAKKIKKSNDFFGEISETKSGSDLLKNSSPNGSFNFIGGAEIQREGIVGIKGNIKKEFIKDNDYIKDNSILVQDIISMSGDHIKLTACIPNTKDVVICNTINQIIIDENYSIPFFWTLINSNLINWYYHKFIYANAIRTMHFNSPVINKLPLPYFDDEKLINSIVSKSKKLYENYQKLWEIKQKMFNFLKDNSIKEIKKSIRNFEDRSYKQFINLKPIKKVNIARINGFEEFFNNEKNECLMFIENEIKPLENELNYLIYELYNLTDEEIDIIQENF